MSQFNPTVSFVRVLSMLLIVATHFLTWKSINSYQLATIGVSIFLFISGYLYGTKNITNSLTWIKQRVKRVLIPFWLLSALFSVYLVVKGEWLFAIKQLFETLLNMQGIHSIIKIPFDFGHYHLSGLSHCWFLTVIIMCYFFVVLLKDSWLEKKIDNNVKKSLLVVCLIHALFCFIDVALGGFVIFFIGYFYKRQENVFSTFFSIRVFVLFTFGMLGMILVRLVMKRYIDGTCFYDFFISSITANISAVWCFLMINVISKKNNIVQNICATNVWKRIDLLSYPLYLTHYMFLKEPLDLKKIFPSFTTVEYLVVFLFLSFISAYILSFITEIRTAKQTT